MGNDIQWDPEMTNNGKWQWQMARQWEIRE